MASSITYATPGHPSIYWTRSMEVDLAKQHHAWTRTLSWHRWTWSLGDWWRCKQLSLNSWGSASMCFSLWLHTVSSHSWQPFVCWAQASATHPFCQGILHRSVHHPHYSALHLQRFVSPFAHCPACQVPHWSHWWVHGSETPEPTLTHHLTALAWPWN